VFMPKEKHEKNQKILKIAENIVLGHIAKYRRAKSTYKDFIDIETVLKRIAEGRLTPRRRSLPRNA